MIELSLARINYDIAAAKVWSIYSQRIVAGVLPDLARAQIFDTLRNLRKMHPADDIDYCNRYEAHVKRVFGPKLRAVK